MDWCRLWHDMPNDPKWRTIARISGQPIISVLSVYIHLMISGSANANERGRTQTNAEDIASALDLDTDQVQSIFDAMQGRVLTESLLSGWERRQPNREDGSAERAKNWRESQKQKDLQNTERNRTQPNATERNRTQPNAPEKIREEENIQEKETPPTPSFEQMQEISDAYDRHQKHHRREGRDLVVQNLISLNGKFNWEKFRQNHKAYCDHYAVHGWDFSTLTLMGWIDAGMPPPPPARSVSVLGNNPTTDKNQRRRNETNEGAKILRNLR